MYSAFSCPLFPWSEELFRFQLWLTGSRRARGSGTKHMFTSNKQFGIRGMPGDPIQHCTNLGRRYGSLHVVSDSGSSHALLYLHCFWNVLMGCIHVQCESSNLLTWTLKKNTAYGSHTYCEYWSLNKWMQSHTGSDFHHITPTFQVSLPPHHLSLSCLHRAFPLHAHNTHSPQTKGAPEHPQERQSNHIKTWDILH